MTDWLLLILFALLGSIISLVGGFYLLLNRAGARVLQKIAVPIAAGALLAASFFDLLPEALHTSDSQVLLWTLAGFLLFFVLERFLGWFHHHHEHTEARQENRSLIIIGDMLHNFIDGLAIGAAFLVSPATGVVTTLAVAAHEIPQEIGDFGLLLSKGMSKRNVVWVNVFSALTTVIGAALVFGAGQQLALPIDVLLAITAGFFIYIAASDIVPTIHQKNARLANVQALVLILAVIAVGVTTKYLHTFIEGEHSPSQSQHQEQGNQSAPDEAEHEHHEHQDHHETTHE